MAIRKYGLFAVILISLPLHAAIRERFLVSTQWLHDNSSSVQVLHAGSPADYEAGHIPGALLIDSAGLLAERDGVPNEIAPVETLEKLFREAGVTSGGRIVVTGRDPIVAARAWLTLDYLGAGDRASLLDGGVAKWIADGFALSTEPVIAEPGSFEARPAPEKVTHLATLREMVRLREQLGSNFVLIDARPPAQFSEHIPGAINVPWTANVDATGAFRSVDELRALYEGAGVSGESENVVYCRTGMQASVTYFILRYLGYDAVLYDGSYIEWSKAGELPES